MRARRGYWVWECAITQRNTERASLVDPPTPPPTLLARKTRTLTLGRIFLYFPFNSTDEIRLSALKIKFNSDLPM